MTAARISLIESARGGFEQDGFAVVPGLLDPGTVARISSAMDLVYRGDYRMDRRPPRVRQRMKQLGSADSVQWVLNARILDPDLWAIATDARLGEIAAGLLRCGSVSIVEDQLLDKPPGGLPVNFHQDYSYWSFSRSTRMISCWIALVDVDDEMGPLEMVPGSHRWGVTPRPKELIRGSEQTFLEAVEAARPASAPFERVVLPVAAGTAVFFHSLTFHGSARNQSSLPRRAISLHWASDECRIDLAESSKHDHPYFFSRLQNGGPIVNDYMPQVYPASG